MADNGTPELFICPLFEKGCCQAGNNCRFRHDFEPPNDDACIPRYLRGKLKLRRPNITATSMKLTNTTRSIHVDEKLVKAPEFILSTTSSVAGSSTSNNEMFNTSETSIDKSKPLSYAQMESPSDPPASDILMSIPCRPFNRCPYFTSTGLCKTNGPYLYVACIKKHEVDKEVLFIYQRSKEMSCGICYEKIMEKSASDRKFGILPNCNHCYCLNCITKWKLHKNFEKKIRKACPECRVISEMVYPSMYWVDAKEEKEKLIMNYKNALSITDCKYFNKGLGKCPLGNKCMMLHALPDGTKIDIGPPSNSDHDSKTTSDQKDEDRKITYYPSLRMTGTTGTTGRTARAARTARSARTGRL